MLPVLLHSRALIFAPICMHACMHCVCVCVCVCVCMHVCVCVCMHMHMHIQVHTYIYHIDMLRSDSPTRLFILYQRTSSYNMYVYTPTHTHTHTKLSIHLYLYGADSVAPAFVVPILRGREKHGKFRHQGVDLQQSDAGLLCCLV
jgi:hypothetical protein